MLGLAACSRQTEIASPAPTGTPFEIAPTSAPPPPVPLPEPTATLPPSSPVEVELPAYDPYSFKLSHNVAAAPLARTLPPAPPSRVGDVHDFYVFDPLSQTGYRSVRAELLYVNELVEMWVERGASIDRQALATAADAFAALIAPLVRQTYGEEWSPGMDGDPRIAVLHVSRLLQAAAYFNPIDEFPAAIEPYSNQREMMTIGLNSVQPEDPEYLPVLAHEFQHLIQWNNDRNEDTWLNEGLSQLAERLAGSSTVWTNLSFLSHTGVQLNHWPVNRYDTLPHYGAAYLFTLYLAERFGDEIIGELARHPHSGLAAVRQILAARGVDADAVFADWTVANLLDDPALEDGRFGYQGEELRPACPRQTVHELPASLTGTLPQYSAQYLSFEGEGRISVLFDGETEVGPIPRGSRGEGHFWWSNRGENAHTTLTRRFDLSGLSSATLQYLTWFDIQPFQDFGYLSASNDGGQTWNFQLAPDMWTGAAFGDGPHYSGVSGGGARPQWIQQSIDLAPFVGGELLLRFEYVAQAPYSGHGWAIDEIRVPELGFQEDAESDAGGWQASGFVRTDFRLPQRWEVHLVHDGQVQRLEVRSDGVAGARFSLEPGREQAILVIAALAPRTKVEADYRLTVEGTGSLRALPEPPAGSIFADQFGDVCSGWWIERTAEHRLGYHEGRFNFELIEPNDVAISTPGLSLTDAELQVSSMLETSAGNNGWGVVCRYQNPDNYYAFEFRDDGMYSIYAIDDGRERPLENWAPAEGLVVGAGAENQITASCIGNQLSLSVNGVSLGSELDDRFPVGDFGLMARTHSAGGSLVSFDDVLITRPDYRDLPGLILFEDFSDSKSGWQERSTADFNSGYRDGQYQIEVRAPDLLAWSLANQELQDVILEVDTVAQRSVLGSSFGVFCRYTDADNTYGFEISPDGWFVVYMLQEGQFVNLVDWTQSGAIRSGARAANHLQISCIGNELSLSVNGRLVASVLDATHSHGDVALAASTYLNGGTRVTFDNLLLREP